MIHGKTLRITLTGVIVALMATAPVAQAKQQNNNTDVHVCNQATHNSTGGDYVADGTDTGSAAKYQTGLKVKSGQGGGLANAAARSSALSLCSVPGDETTTVTEPPPGGDVVIW